MYSYITVVYVALISTLDFLWRTYLLDLNASACDVKCRECTLYVMKRRRKVQEQNSVMPTRMRIYCRWMLQAEFIGGWSCLPCASQRRDASAKIVQNREMSAQSTSR
jgi:hypothetical protein